MSAPPDTGNQAPKPAQPKSDALSAPKGPAASEASTPANGNTKPEGPKPQRRPRRRNPKNPNTRRGKAPPKKDDQAKDDGESEPEGRAVRRTAGTPSQSESESEEDGPKSPEPTQSPKAQSPEAKSPEVKPQVRLPKGKFPKAGTSGPKSPEVKSPEVKSPEAQVESLEPKSPKVESLSKVESSEPKSPGVQPTDSTQAGDREETIESVTDEPGQDKKLRKPHGPGYLNKDRHKTGGDHAKPTSKELDERMERIRLQNERIKQKREEADADAAAFHESLAADRARMKEQLRVQSSIDEERKKNAERKMDKVQGREWDAQKDEADWNHPGRSFRGRGGRGGRGVRGGRGRGGFNNGRANRQDTIAKSPDPADPNDKAQFPDLQASTKE